MALTDNLVSGWTLNSVATDIVVATGNDLTLNGGAGYAAGKLGNCLALVRASSQFASRASNASLNPTGSFTFSGWFQIASKDLNQYMGLLTKWGAANVGYYLYYNWATDRVTWSVSADGSATTTVTASTFGSPPLNTWFFVVVWYDDVAHTINVQVNDGTVDSTAFTGPAFASTAAFQVGCLGGLAGQELNGLADDVYYWSDVKTAGERTALYGGGNGFAWPFATFNAAWARGSNQLIGMGA